MQQSPARLSFATNQAKTCSPDRLKPQARPPVLHQPAIYRVSNDTKRRPLSLCSHFPPRIVCPSLSQSLTLSTPHFSLRPPPPETCLFYMAEHSARKGPLFPPVFSPLRPLP